MAPFFSIVIPTYNRAELIQQTLKSVLDQEFYNFEVIVIDDGGFDSTENVVRHFENDKIFYYWKVNGERGAARNFGVEKAIGNYVFFLDSDDLLKPTFLSTAYELILKSNSPVSACLPYHFIRNGVEIIRKFNYSSPNDALIRQNIVGSHFFVRLDIAKSVKYSENRKFMIGEDWCYVLNVLRFQNIVFGEKGHSLVTQHDTRSMATVPYEKILESRDIFLALLPLDTVNDRKIFVNVNYELTNLASLHAAISRHRKSAVKLFLTSIRLRPARLFTRRTLAIIKKLI